MSDKDFLTKEDLDILKVFQDKDQKRNLVGKPLGEFTENKPEEKKPEEKKPEEKKPEEKKPEEKKPEEKKPEKKKPEEKKPEKKKPEEKKPEEKKPEEKKPEEKKPEDPNEKALREGRNNDLKVTLKALFLASLAGIGAYVIIKDTKPALARIFPRTLGYSTVEYDDVNLTDDDAIEFVAANETLEETKEEPVKEVTEDKKTEVTEEEPAKEATEDKKTEVTDDFDSEEEPVVVEEQTEEETSNSLKEEFENVVAEFVKKNGDINARISVSDITKFVAFANIDYIVENDPELANALFSDSTKEEDLNDAGKVMGAIEMYNTNVWNSTNSTEGFIRISDVIMDSQKTQMLRIENYVDIIANAQAENNIDSVNDLTSEFIDDIGSGNLSKLDDGVGLMSQVWLALITDGIAKDTLNAYNEGMLEVLKQEDRYISNIFVIYDKCSSEGKTLSR